MRRSLLLAVALGLASPVLMAWQASKPDIWVTVEPFGRPGGSAAIRVTTDEIYVGGNSVSVGVTGQQAGPLQFSIRAWREGEKARVVVYASLEDKRAPGGRTETPISTFTIAPRETVQVPEAEKWGGIRLAVMASLR